MSTARRIILWTIIILIAITLQTTVIPYLSFAGVHPDIVVASVMVLSLWYGRLGGIWSGFFTGLLLDIWAPENLGLQALAFTSIGAMIGFFENRRINSGPIFQFFLFVLGSVVHSVIIAYFAETPIGDLGEFVWGNAVPRGLFTALFGMGLVFTGHQITPRGRR